MPPKSSASPPASVVPPSTSGGVARQRAQTFLPSEGRLASPTKQNKPSSAAPALRSGGGGANHSFGGTSNVKQVAEAAATEAPRRTSPTTRPAAVGGVVPPAKVGGATQQKSSTPTPPATQSPAATATSPLAAVASLDLSGGTLPMGGSQLPPSVVAAAAAPLQVPNSPTSAAVGAMQHHQQQHQFDSTTATTTATVASISSLIAGMLERKGSTTDETQEAARWMRSELILLVEQANALKERRHLLEGRRADLVDAVVDHIVHLLPSHLISGASFGGAPLHYGGQSSAQSQQVLQQRALSQAVNGRTNPWTLQPPQDQALMQAYGAGAPQPPVASTTYYHSSRQEASNILCAALDAQRALFRCKLSLKNLELHHAGGGGDDRNNSAGVAPGDDTPPLPGFSSTLAGGAASNSDGSNSPLSSSRRVLPIAQELRDAHSETRKRTIELDVLTNREALLQQQSQALLQEMRAELEKRDVLLKRRGELKKSDAAATTSASALATASTSGLGSSTSALLAEYSMQELRDRKEALTREWNRLRDAASARLQQQHQHNDPTRQPTHHDVFDGSRRTSSTDDALTLLHSRRSVDPTILLLPYAAAASATKISSSQQLHALSLSKDGFYQGQKKQHEDNQQYQRWVLPEQYLVRTL